MALDKKRVRKCVSVGILLLIFGLLAFGMTGCQAKQTVLNSSSNDQAIEVTTEISSEVATEQPASSVIMRTVATIKGDYQEVAIDLKANGYSSIVVQKGIPVKFNIRATEDAITGCNSPVVLSDFQKEMALKPGDNIVEFTPSEVGSYQYECWMGMLYSTIKVVDDLSVLDSTGN